MIVLLLWAVPAWSEARTLTLEDGTLLRYGLTVPEIAPGERVPLVLGLHYGWSLGQTPPAYYGRDYMDILLVRGLGELNAVIVAPDSLASRWSDPINDAALLQLVAAIRDDFPVDPDRIVVTGFSLCGMGAWSFAARHPDLVSAAIPMAGRPSDEAFDNWENVPVYAIHGGADELVPSSPAREAVAALADRGVAAAFVEVPGLSHFETVRYADALNDAIAWLHGVWSSAD